MERKLILHDDVSFNLYRLNKGCEISVVFDGCFGKFYINYPLRSSTFKRSVFNCVEDSNKTDDYCAKLKLTKCGVFNFYVKDEKDNIKHSGTFVVNPSLKNKYLEIGLDCVVLQTVLVKCLGIFESWEDKLLVSHQAGYNVLHFTPVQELGSSRSSYSIRDHHRLNPEVWKNYDNPEQALEQLITSINNKWGMFSIVDVVWNHVANDCPWITQQPDSAYNLVNSPHLRPAFIVDRALWYLNAEIAMGMWENQWLTKHISTEKDLQKLEAVLRNVLTELHLEEYFLLDPNRCLAEFKDYFEKADNVKQSAAINSKELAIIQDVKYKRNNCYIDNDIALKVLQNGTNNNNLSVMLATLQGIITELNAVKLLQVQETIEKILGNVLDHVRYHFVSQDGPKYPEVNFQHSISTRYFCYPFEDMCLAEDIRLMDDPTWACLVMAHNGWVMGGDALSNFAASNSAVYLERQLIAWGDSIKLRYGDRKEDSPFLWTFMEEYTQKMARIFHGFRIDNCHSTPMHVAQHLLDCAREVREDLYVVAELFTNNEETDNKFINKLGINSLIRESQTAGTPREFGRYVYHFGGDPVGSFIKQPTDRLNKSRPHALFMDVTHDNPSFVERRTVEDMVATAAIVLSGDCACGSSRGFDELIPHHINVVSEEREYASWNKNSTTKNDHVNFDSGFLKYKQILNYLHQTLHSYYNQIFVDQRTEEITVVTRHNQHTHHSYIFIAHSAMASDYVQNCNPHQNVVVTVEGSLEEIVLEASVERTNDTVFKKDDQFINGDRSYTVLLRENIPFEQSEFCKIVPTDEKDELHLSYFPPGAVIVVKCSQKPQAEFAVQYLRENVLTEVLKDNLSLDFVNDIDLNTMNNVLYRCNNEEPVYNVPDHGPLVYAGLQGIYTILSHAKENNDLGHPLFGNLRSGDWLLDYIIARLRNNYVNKMADWFEEVFAHIRILPRYLIPSYFEAIVIRVYKTCLQSIYKQMSCFVQNGSALVKQLALGSVQMCGEDPNSTLPPVLGDCGSAKTSVTMAAGLPHFCHGFMRCWGRDTFISLRGSLLVTGRFQLARTLLLAFAGCVRHGLIPNLLAGGVGARYNSRDATWFWLQAIQDYCTMTDDYDLLKTSVQRMYPRDDAMPTTDVVEALEDTIHEVLQRHFAGVEFRERNAGPQLDEHMNEKGFDIKIGVNKDTGFVFGGSEYNCGTWMDKMGSSEKAGNKAVPATPRDGSAVEIVGLSYSTLKWLNEIHEKRVYKHHQVTDGPLTWTYKEWSERILANFQSSFYIDVYSEDALVNKTGIYKDTCASSHGYTDYQLRPNYSIAMCVASDLFEPFAAWNALEVIEEHLLGPLGLATLDPGDWVYNGVYENHQDTDDKNSSRGFNYHQGPEWLWVLGYYLRAVWIFARKTDLDIGPIKTTIYQVLANHKRHLEGTDWAGLPELTNKNGAYCSHSCPTQSWSMACLLEVLYDVEK